MRIVHLTSAHPHDDIRIFVKMCCFLATAGCEVHLVAPRDDTDQVELIKGVRVHPVPMPRNRKERMFDTVKAVLSLGSSLDGDVYHFHDPEFLRHAPSWQRRLNRPFIYDVHEDYRMAVLDRAWLHTMLRVPLSRYFGWLEDRSVAKLAATVAATPAIAERFSWRCGVTTVQNFPMRHELSGDASACGKSTGLFAYVGGITPERGAREMIQAANLAGVGATVAFAGPFGSEALRQSCLGMDQQRRLRECGVLDRSGVRDLLAEASAGLVLFHPLGNHVRAQPNKLFEYMSAGLPVIASDFPLWRAIVAEADCGLLVDPLDPKSIAGAMCWIMDHPVQAREMGARGRAAVLEKYNWESEFPKLLSLYGRLVACK